MAASPTAAQRRKMVMRRTITSRSASGIGYALRTGPDGASHRLQGAARALLTLLHRDPTMLPHRSSWTAAALLLAACGGGSSRAPVETGGSSETPELTRTVVLQGLSSPWDIAVAADGSMFFTERCRGLSVRRPDGVVTRIFGTSGSALVAPDLLCAGQSGVHGVALDPGFATNRTLYVYMLSTLNSSPRTNRVVRLVLGEGYTSAGGRADIIT